MARSVVRSLLLPPLTAGLVGVALTGVTPDIALAAGPKALVYTGNGGGYLSSSNTSRLQSSLRAAGATAVDFSATWPGASLETDYKLVFIALPTATFSASQATDLNNLIADGGGVILIGEGHGFAAQNNTINDLASQLSVPMRASTTSSTPGSCGTGAATGSDALVSGASSLEHGYAALITGGTALYNNSGVFAARSGSVVMVTDSNVWTEPSCNSGSTNNAFFGNLWTVIGCTPTTWYSDVDGDGFGTSTSTSACAAPAGYVAATGDCDDGDSASYPGAFEIVGDEKDQSCDGGEICYADLDDDGWRTGATVVSADADCVDSTEARGSEPAGDCDDSAAGSYPGAAEIAYDGIDQDCSGLDLCDVDEDGFDARLGSCRGTDCDDDSDAVNPGLAEVWYDGIDQNCDGWSDFDADFDGFDSATYDGEDCHDGDDAIHPDADEIWYDDVDQDCDEGSDYDADGDGFDSADFGGEDCDDERADVYPGAPEIVDGIDNDCNGVDEGDDSDGDGISDEDELDLGLDPSRDDSDGDGVLDGDELGDDVTTPLDTDDDGIIDALDDDDDGDGILTRDERGDDDTARDSDGDGTPDHLDLDSDDDGFDDADELDGDRDRDGIPDYRDLDSDNDSVLDADELDADTDGDSVLNRLDADDDGDGWSTFEEESWDDLDLDGDGVVNYLDADADGDGLSDSEDGFTDSDCDGIPDVQDRDDTDSTCSDGSASTYQSGSCSTGAAPAGLGGLLLGLFALAGVRRRR